jgi:hypothetical protein
VIQEAGKYLNSRKKITAIIGEEAAALSKEGAMVIDQKIKGRK